MLQLRDVRLRNSEPRRCLGLRQPAPRNQVVDLHCELDAQLTLAGVGEAKIAEDIATADLDRFTFSCHNARRRPCEKSVGRVYPIRYIDVVTLTRHAARSWA